MLKRNCALGLLVAAVLMLSPLQGAKRAGDGSQQKQIATAVIASSGVDWAPNRDYDGAELTVSGPDGEIFRGAFAAGAPLFFDFLDADGNPLRDGTYKYELVFVPVISDQVREQMLAARQSGDESLMTRLRESGQLPSERMVMNGSFTLVDGVAVDPDLPESNERQANGAGDDPGFGGIAPQDVVHNDDVIATGSLCVGFDCVNGENFGFDTLRLKENNLRFHFDDTSNSGSFPNNDWRIVANDSSNGGANYLAIEDSTAGRFPFRVEAGARANALYVEADGDIGIGTANPAVDLEIQTGNTPTLRLNQDGSSGFTSQVWDVAGNEANFFVRDVTNGSRLSFRIRPGAPESSIDIAANGNVGIGTSSPQANLHVNDGGSSFSFNAATALGIQNTSAANSGVILGLVGGTGGNAQITFGDSGDQAAGRIRFNNSTNSFDFDTEGATRMSISSAGVVTTTTAGTCNPGPCDGTFSPEYRLESIEDHAQFMWENHYLWGVGPTPEDGPFNITNKLTGILHELEKAHIYIEQLHKRILKLEEDQSPNRE